jgi:6-phosphogluconolactonase (cycloisomerase 2 family)
MKTQSLIVGKRSALYVWVALSLVVPLLIAPSAGAQDLLQPVQTILESKLNPLSAIAVSPDGAFVYAGGAKGFGAFSDIYVYSRDSQNNELTFVDRYVSGMTFVQSIAVSANHFYAVNSGDNSLAHFVRDPAKGKLTFSETIVVDQGGSIALSHLSLSPDGKQLYTASAAPGAINVFAVDEATGALSHVETQAQSEVADVLGVRFVAPSPDGLHVYATGPLNTAVIFERDPLTGGLTFTTSVAEGNNPSGSAIAFSPLGTGNHAYIASGDNDAVIVFSRNSETGDLTLVELQTGQKSTDAKQIPEIQDVDFVTVSANGENVYASNSNTDDLLVFSRDSGTGVLTFLESHRESNDLVISIGLKSVLGLAIPSDDGHVYSAASFSEAGGAIGVYFRNPTVGVLTNEDVVTETEQGAGPMFGPSDAAMTAVGSQIYVASPSDSAIVALNRDAGTGRLGRTAAPLYISPAIAFGALVISSDAKHLYAVGDSQLLSMARDEETGELTVLDTITDEPLLAGANDVVISQDGVNVYVAGQSADSIVVYSRDAGTGLLSFMEAHTNGALGVSGISRVDSLAVSDDGLHLYAASLTDFSGTITHFSRSLANGSLGFEQALNETATLLAFRVALSGDGKHLYSASSSVGTISTFERDSGTGDLTTLDSLTLPDGILGGDIQVAPDGRHVYVASVNAGGITVFARNAATGTLSLVERQDGNLEGMSTLLVPAALIIDATSAHVYIPSNANSDVGITGAVQVFEKGVVFSLRGSIVDATSSNAIGCAVIELISSDFSTTFTAVTDINGEYFFTDLPPDSYFVRIVAVGYGQTLHDAIDISGGPLAGQDYFLDTEALVGGVTGTVTDVDSGEPLVGVFVQAFIGPEPVASTYTCATGQFEMANLAVKGSTSVTITYDLPNYEDAQETVEVPVGGTAEANQAMNKNSFFPGSLVGLVLNATAEAPVADALVTITGPVNTSTNTDGSGGYAFPAILEGTYTIHASAVGFDGDTATRNVADAEITQKTFLLVGEAPPTGDLTDINGDNTVDAVDVQLVINAVLGLSIGALDADVNADGDINAVDVQVVINTVLGV